MEENRKKWLLRRRRVSEIIEVGTTDDLISLGYDVLSTVVLLTNVAVTVLYTFDQMELHYGDLLLFLEAVTIAFLLWTMFCVFGLPSFSIRAFQNFRH